MGPASGASIEAVALVAGSWIRAPKLSVRQVNKRISAAMISPSSRNAAPLRNMALTLQEQCNILHAAWHSAVLDWYHGRHRPARFLFAAPRHRGETAHQSRH